MLLGTCLDELKDDDIRKEFVLCLFCLQGLIL